MTYMTRDIHLRHRYNPSRTCNTAIATIRIHMEGKSAHKSHPRPVLTLVLIDSSVNLSQAAGPAGAPYPNQRMDSDQSYNYSYSHHRNGSKESYDSGRYQAGQADYVQFQPYQPDYVDPNLPYHEPAVVHTYGYGAQNNAHARGAPAGRYDRHNSGGYGR